MKHLLAAVFLLALCLPLIALAADVDSWEALEAALGDPAVDSITVTAPLAFPDGEYTIDKPVIFHSTDFMNEYLIQPGAKVTLAEGGSLATVCHFGDPFFINRISILGTLDATAGTIEPDSFFVVNPDSTFLYPEDAEGFSIDYVVNTQEALFDAVRSPLLGSIVIQGGEEELVLTLDQPLSLSGELYVIAGNGFTSLRIAEGGSLVADEWAMIGTQSNFDFENGIFGIAQIMLDGGSLEAKAESILPDSTIFVISGTLTLDAVPEGVSIIGCPFTEEDLISYLENDLIGSIFISCDLTVSQDFTLSKDLQIIDEHTLTIAGTMTVAEGIELLVNEGSTLDSQGTILNDGSIVVDAGAAYTGSVPEGTGTFSLE